MLDFIIPLLFGTGFTLLCFYWDRTEQQYQKRKRTKQTKTPLDKTVNKQ